MHTRLSVRKCEGFFGTDAKKAIRQAEDVCLIGPENNIKCGMHATVGIHKIVCKKYTIRIIYRIYKNKLSIIRII